ncbi:hypothetical protein VNO77_42739 [Canavalia gladiata]|uniref:Uncharacterized protein n=1 Tax=Canavalia gladiata TaxID=3824 RepID=A0AAN9PPD6_CANGL
MKSASVILGRSYDPLQGSPVLLRFIPALGLITSAVYGLQSLLCVSRNLFLQEVDPLDLTIPISKNFLQSARPETYVISHEITSAAQLASILVCGFVTMIVHGAEFNKWFEYTIFKIVFAYFQHQCAFGDAALIYATTKEQEIVLRPTTLLQDSSGIDNIYETRNIAGTRILLKYAKAVRDCDGPKTSH